MATLAFYCFLCAAYVGGGAALEYAGTCKGGAFETTVPSSAVHVKVSDGASIGYCKSLVEATGARQRGNVFILPGWSSTAAQFVQWFATEFANVGYKSFAMDYRAFGLSTGPWTSSVSPQGTLYNGQDMHRIAADAYEVLIHSGCDLQSTVLMGHSIGVYFVWLLINLYAPDVAGIMMLDTSPKHTLGPLPPADPNFPIDLVTREFSIEAFQDYYLDFSQEGVECECPKLHAPAKKMCNYPNTNSKLCSMFSAVLDSENPTGGGFMCYDTACLEEWARGTNYYAGINGFAASHQLFSDSTLDFTAFPSMVRDRTNYPIYMYAGGNSLEPYDVLVWEFDQMHKTDSSKDVFFKIEPGKPGGVHVPWLGQNPNKTEFYDSVTSWLASLFP